MGDNLRRALAWAGLVDSGHRDDDFADEELTGDFEPTDRVEPEPSARAKSGVVTPLDPRRLRPVAREAALEEIFHAHPRSYNADAPRIGECFKDGVPVIINLVEMDPAEATRLVDFVGGLKFALSGSLEKITPGVFMLLPHNVKVTDQDKERIAGGFFAHA
ncbi:MAG: cell division protein SepF [Propionibacteriaceae bacterium]|jgi:cell division inhibitor SepF|nr:cell division protein SepF [Propionibacteriaceae bacterium]